MSQPKKPDLHARYAQELADADDWAGLVRYWIAHQYPPALDQAIEIAEERSVSQQGPWQGLHRFLAEVRENPFNALLLPGDNLCRAWPRDGHLTLLLAALYGRAALC